MSRIDNTGTEHLGLLVVHEESQSCGGSVVIFILQDIPDSQYCGRNIQEVGFTDRSYLVVLQAGQIIVVGCSIRRDRGCK